MNFWWKLGLLLALVTTVLGGTGKIAYDKGWLAGDKHARVELEPKVMDLSRKVSGLESEKAEAERQATAVREASRIKVNEIAAENQALTARVSTLQRSLNDAIRSRTSDIDRAIGSAATRLLNELRPVTGPSTADQAPGAAAEPAANGRSATAASDPNRHSTEEEDDGSGTSERAAALALNERGGLYLRCRERFIALASYVTSITQ